MRKTIVSPSTDQPHSPAEPAATWLDLDQHARIEITSEDPAFPIEDALGPAPTSGWRAAHTGPQSIRIHFDAPQHLHRIHLHFLEAAAERSQEFALFAAQSGQSRRQIVRQQWSFSPGGATEEVEDYAVDLPAVTTLELSIDPDRSHDPAASRNFASLHHLQVG